MAAVRAGLRLRPDVLLLHEGPDLPAQGLAGRPAVRTALERADRAAPNMLVVCGHCHWDVPIIELCSGVQVLNVDHRVVVAMEAN